jgi:hypothetical protein
MQSYRCMMVHDAQTIKEQSILKKGDFSRVVTACKIINNIEIT